MDQYTKLRVTTGKRNFMMIYHFDVPKLSGLFHWSLIFKRKYTFLTIIQYDYITSKTVFKEKLGLTKDFKNGLLLDTDKIQALIDKTVENAPIHGFVNSNTKANNFIKSRKVKEYFSNLSQYRVELIDSNVNPHKSLANFSLLPLKHRYLWDLSIINNNSIILSIFNNFNYSKVKTFNLGEYSNFLDSNEQFSSKLLRRKVFEKMPEVNNDFLEDRVKTYSVTHSDYIMDETIRRVSVRINENDSLEVKERKLLELLNDYEGVFGETPDFNNIKQRVEKDSTVFYFEFDSYMGARRYNDLVYKNINRLTDADYENFSLKYKNALSALLKSSNPSK